MNMNANAFRILDANANRAREALRLLEDYARFALNDQVLCGAIKALRHDFATITKPLLSAAILHRDTPGDVGTQITLPTEQHRTDLPAVVTAGGKRLGEALRAVEEILKLTDSLKAAQIEGVRYRFYAIEQTLARTFPSLAATFARVRLYVLITESLCARPWLETAELAIAGGADCLQLREKDLDGKELLHRAKTLVQLCRRAGVLSIINDRVDICQLADADGVHLGQDDLPCTEARKLLGNDKLIGVSTHGIEQARQALRDGADYIGVGPMFPSTTKPRDILPGLAYARQVAAEVPLPAVAIGGITLPHLPQVLETGIGAIAITAAIASAPDPHQAAAAFKSILNTRGLTA